MSLIRSPGELELWFEGKSVISAKGLIYRKDAASEVKGANFETFFGGKTLITSRSPEMALSQFQDMKRIGHHLRIRKRGLPTCLARYLGEGVGVR